MSKITTITNNFTSSVTTGYYIQVETPMAGKKWTNYLTQQSSSRYLPVSVDLSDYIGGTVTVSADNRSSSSSRVMGLCDVDDYIVDYSVESAMTLNTSTNKYELVFNITDVAHYFFFSISSVGATGLSLVATKDNLEVKINSAIDLYESKKTNTCYVSNNGSDNNNGESRDKPFLTLQKAINSGYNYILIKPDTYTNGITMSSLSDITLVVDEYYGSYDSSNPVNPKVIIDCNSTITNGINLVNCSHITFENIEVINPSGSGWRISKCQDITFESCGAKNCPNSHGFEILYTNAKFYNCYVNSVGTMGGSNHNDGFNIKGTGTTSFYNCNASYCEDDGISHHDICQGVIYGGEYHHCGKGGVASPTHGATIDISGVYCHDCSFGIYAHCDIEANATTFKVSDVVCKNNTNYDISVKNNTGIFWNCIYDTINHEGNTGQNIIIS